MSYDVIVGFPVPPVNRFSQETSAVGQGVIELRGVSVNNLRNIDLDLPRGQLIVICGVSGSGKTSLALDTLYAEGQRRYIETFSPYTRQFLEQLDKPVAERIDGLPPAIAVTHKNPSRSGRATVGSSTDINSLLSLLFSAVGEIICHHCGQPVRRDTPESAASAVTDFAAHQRLMIGFQSLRISGESSENWVARLAESGYIRTVIGGRTTTIEPALAPLLSGKNTLTVILDRLSSADDSQVRLRDSLEAAFVATSDQVIVLVEDTTAAEYFNRPDAVLFTSEIDGRRFRQLQFGSALRCRTCAIDYLAPEPQLFNFNRPLGACPVCHGLGTSDNSKEKTTGADETSKTSDRWQVDPPCPACRGARLRPEALAVRIASLNFFELSRKTVADAISFFDSISWVNGQRQVAEPIVCELRTRLQYLGTVGVGYLSLDRPLRTLSSGEAQRVALTGSLGATLVDMLYVLDEPSVGLHPRDLESLTSAIRGLRDRGNTVVAVEHEPEIVQQADHVVELGPAAGEEGGQIVFVGSPAQQLADTRSRTGDWLAGRRGVGSVRRRTVDHGRLSIRGARGNNLRRINVDFPLGVLCVVTGVSGAGKSTLVERTLYPALQRVLNRDANPLTFPAPLEFDELLGAGQLEEVEFIDQSPIGRSPRSNPATYLKAFDPIRALFAEQPEAKARGFSAGHFSFNIDGGRCEACRGDGFLKIDMQFMPDVYIRCGECLGRRYRREVLEVKYRGRDISEVLDLTAREAFGWFRGEHAVQARVKPLLDVGLGYLRLGQAATTLSGGESQRLKLAAYLSVKRSGRTLLLLDEPTTGLHFSDIVQLLDCLSALLDVGHSLIVVEHNLQLMKAADYLIDLGPGAARDGGRVVAFGTPEDVAANSNSVTGRFLAAEFARDARILGETMD